MNAAINLMKNFLHLFISNCKLLEKLIVFLILTNVRPSAVIFDEGLVQISSEYKLIVYY